jgi:sugar (pentulose or hexulose) kinase
VAFIGIDLGTSYIKGALLDADTNRVSHVRRLPFPEPLPSLDPLFCEFEPAAIAASVGAMIDELAILTGECEGIVLCTQMSTMVLVDSRGGLRSNCIGWRDQRALAPHPSGDGSYYEVLRQRIPLQHLRELGNELPVGAPLSFLFWFSEQRKLIPDSMPLSLADYVMSSLSHSQPSVDATNAMAYQLLNLTKLGWHQEVIGELGLHGLALPMLRKEGEVAGFIQHGTQQIPYFTPMGDYQCALVGALMQEDELSINVSTGSQVSRVKVGLTLGDYQTRPFFDGKFTSTISHLPAGRSLNVLVDLLSELASAHGVGLQDPWPYIGSAASRAGRSDLKVKLSFYPGPAGDSGSISNIREQNLTVGTLFRAALEDMVDNYYASALRVWPEKGWRRLVFSGGLTSKLELLRELLQERFQAEYRQAPVTEDTLFGLLVLAKVFSGRVGSVTRAIAECIPAYISENKEKGQAVGQS